MGLKRRLPLLRWSFIRMGIGARHFSKTGQWGDGREAAAADYVVNNARRGDLDDVLATIDTFAYEKSFLINVGDEKGALLDAAVIRANPRLALELGTYCGYGAMRIARAAPAARVFSVEFSPTNADIARRIWAHAGVADRITCVVGTIGDGGVTLDALAADGFEAEGLDFVFLDHDKNAYLTDLQSLLDRGWLHRGSIVVADNVKLPGAPKYLAYMREHQGGAHARSTMSPQWDTRHHKTHAEYQTLLPDLVLESEYLGG